jgi:surfeit locus 1 family protein
MRPRAIAVAVFVVAAAAVCVRLGFWQLERLDAKRRLNATIRQALALAPPSVADPLSLPDSLLGRRISLHGWFDEGRQVLLAGRDHEGEQGVHVVTPLVMEDGDVAVLVDRGWLPAADAVTARPQDFPVPGPQGLSGVADPLPRGVPEGQVRSLEAVSTMLFSTSRLDYDALSMHFPYTLARFSLRLLPEPGAPSLPVREPPRFYDETMHLSYAIQWFAMAIIVLVGSLALAWSRRRGAAAASRRTPKRRR